MIGRKGTRGVGYACLGIIILLCSTNLFSAGLDKFPDSGISNKTTIYNIDSEDANVRPIARCKSITTYLDVNGSVIITAADIDNGSYDTDGSVRALDLDRYSFDCDDPTDNQVWLTVTDNEGATAQCRTNVKVIDKTAPVITCNDFEYSLDENGVAILDVEDLVRSSKDNCGPPKITSFPEELYCKHLGKNSVKVTATDDAGNTESCESIVNIKDEFVEAVCKDITVNLNSDGEVKIEAESVDGGSRDNCEKFKLFIDIKKFDCSSLATNPNVVILGAEDQNGNLNKCTANVTVLDVTAPKIECYDKNLLLDSNGELTVDPTILGDSKDNCTASPILSADPSQFTCDDLGEQAIEISATDDAGNRNRCTANVKIMDSLAPEIECENGEVELDINGIVEIDPSLFVEAKDNCTDFPKIISNPENLTCENIGVIEVRFTAFDDYDNNASCISEITVKDRVNPTAECQDITVQLDVSGAVAIAPVDVDNGSDDNCGIDEYILDITDFNCDDIVNSPHAVNLTVKDASGNEDQCTANVTVEDVFRPEVTCQNITVELDSQGTAAIDAEDVALASSDNCSIHTLTVDIDSFNCDNLGSNTVVLMARDGHNNTRTCEAIVTVTDPESPIVTCTDITVQLDENGMSIITPMDIRSTSSDNCDDPLLTLDIDNFTCDNIGENTVTLSATDSSNNLETCTATVTVQDVITPEVNCKDITVSLDVSGQATIVALDVLESSSDNCTTITYEIDVSTFDCSSNAGSQVTLTAIDGSNNESTCLSNVTIEEKINPTVVCKDVIVQLDDQGNASVEAMDVMETNTDNCGIPTLSLNLNSFTCDNMGNNTIELTSTDGNGNSASCEAIVTVEDNVAPVLNCIQANVFLDENGTAVIAASDLVDSKTDNCSDPLLSLDVSSFNCNNLGENPIVVTATDDSNNATTCSTTVTVVDTVLPVITCNNIGVQLDDQGEANITVSDVLNARSDNCEIASSSLDVSIFDCSSAGENTITVTVLDNSGNEASCTSIVTIEEKEDPIVTCKNITMELDAQGAASVLAADLVETVSDNCSTPTLTTDISTLNCDHIGVNSVTLTATDAANNSSTCQALVTVVDLIAPTVTCNNITVQLNENGAATVQAEDILALSDDNCAVVNNSIDQDSFDCSHIGVNNVVLTVKDGQDNEGTCISVVTVEDGVGPTVNCEDITVYLDENGSVLISPEEILNTVADNCSQPLLSISETSFDCSNIGANSVELTATDDAQLSAVCTSIVLVQDTISPMAICQDITTFLDADGNAMITAEEINNNSTDACGIQDLMISTTTFTADDLGQNTVELLVTDVNNQVSSCSSTVIVIDTIAPTAVCQNVVLVLDAEGNAAIVAEDLNNNSFDNVEITALQIETEVFNCADIGVNAVTLTVTDRAGLSSTCEALVTVVDSILPTAICQDFTIYLDDAGQATLLPENIDNGSYDDCAVDMMILSQNTFNMADLGTHEVTLTVIDESTNETFCAAQVVVLDTIAPNLLCQSFTVALDSLGFASIIEADIVASSTDNSGQVSLNSDQLEFNCDMLGPNAVLVTATDSSGNVSSCEAQVTVVNNQTPILVCQDITLMLEESGTVSVTPDSLAAVNYFNCETPILTTDVEGYNCFELGENNIVLTSTTSTGLTASCEAIVTVQDIAPTALCMDETVSLNGVGNGSIVLNNIDDGTFDACGLDTMYLSITEFNESNLGANLVTLTAIDINGNIGTCDAMVDVIIDPALPTCAEIINYIDSISPIGLTQNLEWDLIPNASGYIVNIGTTPGGTEIASSFNTSVPYYSPQEEWIENTRYYYTIHPYNEVAVAQGCVESSFKSWKAEVDDLFIPNFFTPNGDGVNDTWTIKFSRFIDNVKIYDRQGRLLKKLNSGESWDGTYKGSVLPEDDYWYFVTIKPNDTLKGHFSLIRE